MSCTLAFDWPKTTTLPEHRWIPLALDGFHWLECSRIYDSSFVEAFFAETFADTRSVILRRKTLLTGLGLALECLATPCVQLGRGGFGEGIPIPPRRRARQRAKSRSLARVPH